MNKILRVFHKFQSQTAAIQAPFLFILFLCFFVIFSGISFSLLGSLKLLPYSFENNGPTLASQIYSPNLALNTSTLTSRETIDINKDGVNEYILTFEKDGKYFGAISSYSSEKDIWILHNPIHQLAEYNDRIKYEETQGQIFFAWNDINKTRWYWYHPDMSYEFLDEKFGKDIRNIEVQKNQILAHFEPEYCNDTDAVESFAQLIFHSGNNIQLNDRQYPLAYNACFLNSLLKENIQLDAENIFLQEDDKNESQAFSTYENFIAWKQKYFSNTTQWSRGYQGKLPLEEEFWITLYFDTHEREKWFSAFSENTILLWKEENGKLLLHTIHKTLETKPHINLWKSNLLHISFLIKKDDNLSLEEGEDEVVYISKDNRKNEFLIHEIIHEKKFLNPKYNINGLMYEQQNNNSILLRSNERSFYITQEIGNDPDFLNLIAFSFNDLLDTNIQLTESFQNKEIYFSYNEKQTLQVSNDNSIELKDALQNSSIQIHTYSKKNLSEKEKNIEKMIQTSGKKDVCENFESLLGEEYTICTESFINRTPSLRLISEKDGLLQLSYWVSLNTVLVETNLIFSSESSYFTQENNQTLTDNILSHSYQNIATLRAVSLLKNIVGSISQAR